MFSCKINIPCIIFKIGQCVNYFHELVDRVAEPIYLNNKTPFEFAFMCFSTITVSSSSD